jgi:hypothetical protein
MGLLYWIKQGFGWGIGHELAKDAYAEAKRAVQSDGDDTAPPDEPVSDSERAARAKTDARAAAKAAKTRAADAKRREKEIDKELAAMKKRLDRR